MLDPDKKNKRNRCAYLVVWVGFMTENRDLHTVNAKSCHLGTETTKNLYFCSGNHRRICMNSYKCVQEICELLQYCIPIFF